MTLYEHTTQKLGTEVYGLTQAKPSSQESSVCCVLWAVCFLDRIGTPDRVLTWFYYAVVPYSLLPMSLLMLLSFYRGPFFSLFVVDHAVQILA